MLIRVLSIVGVVLIASFSAGCSGCGDDVAINPDGALAPRVRLQVVSPESLGLSFAESALLRVQYQHENGEPIAGAQVEFAILESAAGDPGGATLSATAAETDAQGVAMVELTAGAARANFRVEAIAADAAPAYFYVSVSEDGFAILELRPQHRGNRDASTYARVDLRLYRATTVSCANFDVDAELISVFPPLHTDGFDGSSISFVNVSVGMDYTVVGWALIAGTSTRLAAGCVDLPRTVLAPGPRQLDLPIIDRQPALPSQITLASTFLLTPVATELATSAAIAPWHTLACPAGPGQLLLDCTLDALEPDEALDCVVTASTPRVAAVQAARGPADGDDCRPVQDGGDTLDLELFSAIKAGGLFPTGALLDALLDARADTTELLELSSVLDLHFESPLERRQNGSLVHRLETATITVAGTRYPLALGETARPVIAATPVPWSMKDTGELDMGAHGFTLRLGSFAQDAFRDLGLASVGLSARADDLGTAIAESASDSTSSTIGCEAVSAVLCARISESLDCAELACAAAASHLDGSLLAWSEHLNGAAVDFTLAGSAPVRDQDDDLNADTLGVGNQGQDGGWTAIFHTREGTEVGTSGSFGSTMIQSAQ